MVNREILLLATSHGIAICGSEAAGWRVTRRDLPESFFTSVIAQGDMILGGTKDGIFRSSDLGKSWQAVNSGISIGYIRWLAAHPNNPQRIFLAGATGGSRDEGPARMVPAVLARSRLCARLRYLRCGWLRGC